MDNLNPSEISKIIKDRINNLEVSSDESMKEQRFSIDGIK